jgi:hypothetical protein
LREHTRNNSRLNNLGPVSANGRVERRPAANLSTLGTSDSALFDDIVGAGEQQLRKH